MNSFARLPLLLIFSTTLVIAQLDPPQSDPLASTRVSITLPASDAKSAVLAIAKQAGVSLEATDSMKRDILAIRVEDVPLQTLLDKIAEATTGLWKKAESGVMRLVPDMAARTREVQAERRVAAERIRAAIKKMVQSALEKKPAEQGAGSSRSPFGVISSKSDEDQAIARIAQSLDAATLASLEAEGRIVYSSYPTAMQLPLPGNYAPVIADLVGRHNAKTRLELAERKGAEREGKPTDPELERAQKFAEMLGLNREPKLLEGQVGKVLLIVTRPGFSFMGLGGNLTLELRVYDSAGSIIISGQQFIGLEDQLAQIQQLTQPGGEQAETGDPIEYSQATKELDTLFNLAEMSSLNERKPSKELVAKMLRPDLYDPLSFAMTERAFAVAKKRKAQLVANLPDGSGNMMGMFASSSSATVQSAAKEFESGKDTTVVQKDGWYVVRPSRPAESRDRRVDRAALAKFIGAMQGKALPSLADLAEFAVASDPPSGSMVAMRYLSFFAPNAIYNGFRGVANWNMLRFYGSLSPSQRQSLTQGVRIPFGGMTPQQLDLVRKMTFGASGRLELRSERVNSRPDEDPFMRMILQAVPIQSRNVRDEPTEALPNGVPATGFLEVSAKSDAVAMVADAANKPNPRFGALGVEELAVFRSFSEDPKLMEMGGAMMPRVEKLFLGARTSLEFEFRMNPDVSVRQSLTDDKIDPSSAPVGIRELPGNVQSRVEKMMEAMKNSAFPMFGFGQRNVPPRT